MDVVLAALLICVVSMLVLYTILRGEVRHFDKDRTPPAPTTHGSKNN